MSRGLGRLQRFIKDQIYRAEREFKRESVCLFARMKLDPKFDDEGVKTFWLTWPEIRILIEENPEFNRGRLLISGPAGSIEPIRVGRSGPILQISPSLERSAKRALYLLVKRGDIVPLWKSDHRYLNRYITKEMHQHLNESGKAFAEGLARMAKEGRTIADDIREFKSQQVSEKPR
jgi:hypothetical protein